jgi:hypothetical protein
MAIVTPTEPARGRQALQDALQFLISRPADAVAASVSASGGTIDQLQSTQPHRTYSVGVGDLAQGKFLEAAAEGPWRYLLVSPAPWLVASAAETLDTGGGSPTLATAEQGPTAVAEAFLTTDEQGNATCTGVGVSPAVAATIDALVELEQTQSVQASDYELRYLEVSALSFYAVWLHGANDDIVRPIAPTPTTLADLVPAAPGQLLASLQAAAQAVLDQQRESPGDSGG